MRRTQIYDDEEPHVNTRPIYVFFSIALLFLMLSSIVAVYHSTLTRWCRITLANEAALNKEVSNSSLIQDKAFHFSEGACDNSLAENKVKDANECAESTQANVVFDQSLYTLATNHETFENDTHERLSIKNSSSERFITNYLSFIAWKVATMYH